MIRSMTGYGMAEKHTENYSVKVELRSLNGKFLDLSLRVPRFLMPKEIEIRNTFGKKIERGSATLSINVVKHKTNENDIEHSGAFEECRWNLCKTGDIPCGESLRKKLT